MGYVRWYRLGDAEALAPVLRQADVDEIKASSGLEPLPALLRGVKHSRFLRTIIDNAGHVAGLFGVVPTDAPFAGVIWLLGSDALVTPPLSRQFLRDSRRWLNEIYAFEDYDLLYNIIDERNTVHIRWLQWCGFVFINRHEKFGHEQRPFLEFVRIKRHV